MNRRDYLLATLSAAAVAPALASTPPAIAPPSVTSIDERKVQEALKVQRSTLVVDGLDPSALTKEYLGMLKAGGVNCWHQSVGGLGSFAALHTFFDANSDQLVQAGTVKEIRQIHQQGKIAHVSGWQMADPLILDANGQGPLGNLRAYRQLGLRIASIAYNNSNIFGGGCLDPDVPLTRAGHRYVEEVHKQRLVLDVCGHTGERTSFDAVQISKGVPVICSHTNARALMDNPRNISDRLIEAIAKTGGVVGLTAFSDFHVRSRNDANVQRTPQAGLDKHLDQFDHLKKLVGVDHIGLGPDFMTGRSDLDAMGLDRERWPADVYSDWPWYMVKDFETIVELPKVTQGLLDRGWSAADVRKVLGENWLRVYEKVWGA
ncbi:dipeptidase [Steroidobacter flavus]|uniref:Dipeptidase n=1 Tax=Steroidobacter flavus TaxID=1842136 RepID=A0ABV8T441_9GAMM